MYRQVINRLLDEVAETEQFFRAGIVAIDITEVDPFTGDRAGHEDEIIGTNALVAEIVGGSQRSFNDRFERFFPRVSEQFTAELKRSEIRCESVFRDASMR